MNRTFVTSSNIASIGYDAENRILEIEFHNGGIYQYSGVLMSEYQNLMNANSHGGYFAQNIKNVYSFTKIK